MGDFRRFGLKTLLPRRVKVARGEEDEARGLSECFFFVFVKWLVALELPLRLYSRASGDIA